MLSISMKTERSPKCCASRSRIRPVIASESLRRYEMAIFGMDHDIGRQLPYVERRQSHAVDPSFMMPCASPKPSGTLHNVGNFARALEPVHSGWQRSEQHAKSGVTRGIPVFTDPT